MKINQQNISFKNMLPLLHWSQKLDLGSLKWFIPQSTRVKTTVKFVPQQLSMPRSSQLLVRASSISCYEFVNIGTRFHSSTRRFSSTRVRTSFWQRNISTWYLTCHVPSTDAIRLISSCVHLRSVYKPERWRQWLIVALAMIMGNVRIFIESNWTSATHFHATLNQTWAHDTRH